MAIFPKIEQITRDTTVSHFFLMFGYKLFSLYFPLFLIARGLSFPEVGFTYLFIYLPIAVFAPIAGFLSRKINSVILASVGIFGYGIYCLAMILVHPTEHLFLFYSFQIFLGICASLFFVNIRNVLISSRLENSNRAFAWFYSAPYYASAIAPIVGALLIWKFDFYGVFVVSLVIQFLNAIFCIISLRKSCHCEGAPKPYRSNLVSSYGNLTQSLENYKKVFGKLKEKAILIPIIVCSSVLVLGGFYRAFFVLFLKDLQWTQNQILFFASLLSFVFLPISLFAIKQIGKTKTQTNIFQGVIISGLLSIVLGSLGAFANFYSIFAVKITQSVGGLMSGSGRSGLLSKKLEKYPEQASAIDTIFSPMGMALGSLIAGLIIGYLGFNFLFIFGGIFVVITAIIGYFLMKMKLD